MRVRLIRKLADEIDGIDLSQRQVGDTIDLPRLQGHLLIAEGWAQRERRGGHHSTVVLAFRRATDLGHWRPDDTDELWRAS
jgi:hypothetical protein